MKEENLGNGDSIASTGSRFKNAVDAVLNRGVNEHAINDEQFAKDLQELKSLRSFFIKQAVSIDTDGSDGLRFGSLNLLYYHHNGRPPTHEEWAQVEWHTQSLFRLMTESLRRKFTLGTIPWWVSYLPVVFALIAAASLILVILLPGLHGGSLERSYVLPFYLVWLLSLGAIGAIAFIGMNVLSVQEDITFDLTNERLMSLRIALGALFGLVLTLPFGFEGFVQFCEEIIRGKITAQPGALDGSQVTTQAVMLLLPFILGFSTSLVILILNRLVDAVQGFFGKSAPADRQVPTAPARPSTTKERGSLGTS
jgi:hypothetical protein